MDELDLLESLVEEDGAFDGEDEGGESGGEQEPKKERQQQRASASTQKLQQQQQQQRQPLQQQRQQVPRHQSRVTAPSRRAIPPNAAAAAASAQKAGRAFASKMCGGIRIGPLLPSVSGQAPASGIALLRGRRCAGVSELCYMSAAKLEHLCSSTRDESGSGEGGWTVVGVVSSVVDRYTKGKGRPYLSLSLLALREGHEIKLMVYGGLRRAVGGGDLAFGATASGLKRGMVAAISGEFKALPAQSSGGGGGGGGGGLTFSAGGPFVSAGVLGRAADCSSCKATVRSTGRRCSNLVDVSQVGLGHSGCARGGARWWACSALL